MTDETTELYVGMCRASVSASGRWVCLDEIGRPVHEGALAWSAPGMRRMVELLSAAVAGGAEVTVGLPIDEAPPDMLRTLCESGLEVRAVEAWMLDALWRSQKRSRQTVVMRARCVAQVLLIACCPPGRLRSSEGKVVVSHAQLGAVVEQGQP